jgi:hypothetical protein
MPVRLVSGISFGFPRLSRSPGQVTHVLLTRSPLIISEQAPRVTVRLACFKHAASVRPEPGSNSPLMSYDRRTGRHYEATPKSRIMIWQNGNLAFPFVQKESFRVARTSGGSRPRSHKPIGVYLASIFDTLLSSQRADAHHPRPLGRFWGNLSTLDLAFVARQLGGIRRVPS